MDSPLAPKHEPLSYCSPSHFPCPTDAATGSGGESSKGSREEVASNDTADGNLPMGRKGAQVLCCQQKPPINRGQHIKPLLLICCLDLKRLLFSLSSKLQLLTLFLSLCLYGTQAFLLPWRFNN